MNRVSALLFILIIATGALARNRGSIGFHWKLQSVRIEEPTIFDRNLFTESEMATSEEIAEYTLNSQKIALAQARRKGHQVKRTKTGATVN
jgi:hypothetical protein